jgi:septal ring-binding cell division protein DamX
VIKRNKVTGEEIVVSTEPVTEEAKTLDPNKVADDKDKENVSPEAATATATTASPAKTSASPAKTSSSPAKTSSSKKSGEKKGGFLRKLKKAFQ